MSPVFAHGRLRLYLLNLLAESPKHGYELIQRTLARGAHFLGRTKTNVVLPPAEVLPDGSYLSAIYPSQTARRRREGGLIVRVVEYALDTPAGPGTERYRLLSSARDLVGAPDAEGRTHHRVVMHLELFPLGAGEAGETD